MNVKGLEKRCFRSQRTKSQCEGGRGDGGGLKQGEVGGGQGQGEAAKTAARTTKPKDAELFFLPAAQSASSAPPCTHRPELDEVLQHGGGNEQAVHQRVGQEEDEELVVGEAHAVVDPGEAQTQTR